MKQDFGISSFFFNVLRKILFFWVKTTTDGTDPGVLQLDPNKRVCYVLQYSSLSNRLVLEQECQKASLPSAQAPMALKDEHLRRSFFFLYERQGSTFQRQHAPSLSTRLTQLVENADNDPSFEVQLVPVSIFWGRSPDKEKSILKILWSDTWSVTGRLRKLFIILLNGRNTYVQFSKPISLRQITDESETQEIACHKLARYLRVHFSRVRSAVVGPDLSHRRTLVESLLKNPPVVKAIKERAEEQNIPISQAQNEARMYGDEIASNLSIGTIRFLEILLSWVWNKIYNGINIRFIERAQRAARTSAVVYVPCHRSHIDYLLLSYVLYTNGLMVPHIAAGINLNMPVVGPILRRSGAFFMRRSFRDNQLYSAVFNEYMHAMTTKGYPMEYFVEGGRSRTGRMLPPRTGMLAMTSRSYLRNHQKPIALIPVYIGYEKIIEARTYLGELRGQQKESESLFGVFKSLKKLTKSFGKVAVNFGEPIAIDTVFDSVQPGWRDEPYDPLNRPEWLSDAVNHLAIRVATGINNAAAINPVNLCALALNCTERQAMDERALVAQLNVYSRLLREVPYSNSVTIVEGDGESWIRYVEDMGLAQRIRHPLGDIISLEGVNGILMTYYRNSSLHVFALPSLIACLFQNNDEIEKEHLIYLIQTLYPYIKPELFLRWDTSELPVIIEQYLKAMKNIGLLKQVDSRIYHPSRGSEEFVMLDILAKPILQTLERFYMAIELLRKNGKDKTTPKALEEQCTLMAQRMSILYGINAPEFFDKMLFRGFIAELQKNDVLQLNEDGTLGYSDVLDDVSNDAHYVLNAQLRQGVKQVTQT